MCCQFAGQSAWGHDECGDDRSARAVASPFSAFSGQYCRRMGLKLECAGRDRSGPRVKPPLRLDRFLVDVKRLLFSLTEVDAPVATCRDFRPFHEARLMRCARIAAKLPWAGAIIGVSLTVPYGISLNERFLMFVRGCLAKFALVGNPRLIHRSLPDTRRAIETRNVAIGCADRQGVAGGRHDRCCISFPGGFGDGYR